MSQDAETVAAELLQSEAKMEEFIEFLKNEAANPPKVRELFKAPSGLSPAWQEFFDKVTAYHERQCEDNRHALIALEKRSWVLEDEKLSEIEMLMTATEIKMKGNEEFAKGDIARAQILYSSAISMFPTPDAMNNMAACSLKQNQFDLAETFTTKALDMDLFSNPVSAAKAYYRRASARFHKANFEGAREDAISAKQSSPSDSAQIDELLRRIEASSASVETPEEIEGYLKKQPQSSVNISLPETFNKILDLGIAYTRIPEHTQTNIKGIASPPSF